jgi:hypothetical protein
LIFAAALAAGARLQALDLRIAGTEPELRAALERVAAAGGGTITFNVSGTAIGIQDRIVFHGSDVVLDGENRGLTLRYTGPDDCSQTEGQDPFIEIHGDRNVIRNFTLERFPDGIHVQHGYDNLIENLRFPKVCEDAVTNSGRGLEAFRTIIRNCYFADSEDKAVMINEGGSVTVEDCEFINTTQPVRAGGRAGRYVVRHNVFRGRSTGPRFNGGADGLVVIFENNVVEDAGYALRIYGSVHAVIRNNRFRPRASNGYGVYIYENARARLAGNEIQGASGGGVLVQGKAQVDLGGGRLVICGDPEPSEGGNILKGNEPADLVNQTDARIPAKFNFWDHGTAADVRSIDVRGAAEVEPMGTKPAATTPRAGRRQ